MPLLLLLAAAAAACGARSTAAAAAPALTHALLAKAPVDSCFAGFGQDAPPFANATARRCPFGSEPRVNGAYVFSIARAPQTGAIWFGTRCAAQTRLLHPLLAAPADNAAACAPSLRCAASTRGAR